METCDEPIFPSFEDTLRSSQQVYPATRLPLPGSEEARLMTAGSGRQCSMWLSESDPLFVFSRTLMESSAWTNSEEYCYVWERLDTKFECSGFQLTPLGQSTEGTECSLWRMPNGSDATGGPMDGQRRLEQGHQLNLQEQAATPKLWPTPRAEFDSGKHCSQADTLHSAAKLWPTPTSRDHKDGTSGNGRTDILGQAVNPNSATGSLSPNFVEWLMGFPRDWTLISGELPKCRTRLIKANGIG